MRLVLDTSVIVSAFRSREGASFRLLEIFREGRYIAVATPTLFLEYKTVLHRPEHRAIHQLSDELLADALLGLADRMEAVHVDFQWKPQLSDPADEMVLEAAMNGHAYAIITHNLRDFLPAAERFGLRVMTPGATIKGSFPDGCRDQFRSVARKRRPRRQGTGAHAWRLA